MERITYPTQERLNDLLDYNPHTGLFVWKERPLASFNSQRYCNSWNSKYAGKEAGYCNNVGIPMIPIGRPAYKASRLAYIYVYGEVGDGDVDHINRNIRDNRISNLRYVTHGENGINRNIFRNNKSGVTGVSFNKKAKKWQAYIKVNRKDCHLGYFHKLKNAAQARYDAEVKHGFTEFNPNSTAYQYLQEAV